MAVISITRARSGAAASVHNPAAAIGDLDITRLYRAFVSQENWRRPELTVFVEAGSREAAARKIVAAIAVVEYRKPEGEIAERIYNLSSAAELVDENISDDHAARLFETGWSGGEVTCWVRAPLVLLADPAPLLRAWARVVGVRS